MEPRDIRNLLRTVGIPLGVVVVLGAIGVGIYAYRNYLETVKLKLEISELQKDMGIVPKFKIK